MTSKYFYNFIKGREGLSEIKDELTLYISRKRMKKDSFPVFSDLNENGESLNNDNLIKLFQLYIESRLGEWELEYFLNWIELSGFGLTDMQEKIIFLFSTPEINYPITKKNIKKALKILENNDFQCEFSGSYNYKNYKSIVPLKLV